MTRHYFGIAVALLLISSAIHAQTALATPYYSRANGFGLLAAYSNDSSHILLGIAEQRKLLSFGGSYSRRLVRIREGVLVYDAELLPVALESDPVVNRVEVYTSPINITFKEKIIPIFACHNDSGSSSQTSYGFTYTYTYTDKCSRRWTIGEAMSPVGLQWNFLPKHKLQPLLEVHGGYMYTTQPIPVVGAGSFNFTFDFGTGFELYRTKTRSIRAECRYRHTSNHQTAQFNPGIDNGLFQIAYVFGR